MLSVDEYLERERADGELSEDTLRTREHYLNKIDEWFQDNLDKPIGEADVEDCVRFFENFLEPKWRQDTNKKVVRDENGRFKEMKTDGMTTDTARIYFNTLQSFMAENLGRLERREQNFDEWFEDMRGDIPGSDYKKKMAQSDPKVFERDELSKIMRHAGVKYQLIYGLMLDSGRRPKEVASIKISDIEFVNGQIEYDILKKDLPTRKMINVDEEVMELLQEYVKKKVDTDQEYLFETSSEQGHLTTSSMGKALKRHAERAGVDLGDRSLKNLRHTYVTFRRESGHSFANISSQGTQNTIQVMQESYSGRTSNDEHVSGMDIMREEE
jgi:integrase